MSPSEPGSTPIIFWGFDGMFRPTILGRGRCIWECSTFSFRTQEGCNNAQQSDRQCAGHDLFCLSRWHMQLDLHGISTIIILYYIYYYINEWLIFTANVGKYTIYMDGMGRTTQIYTFYKFGWPTNQEQSPGFDTSLLENPKNTLHLPPGETS